MSKDNNNLNNMRTYLMHKLKGFRVYVSQLPDSKDLHAHMMGDDGGERFIKTTVDEIIAKLGYPVKTMSSADKAWKHVHGG